MTALTDLRALVRRDLKDEDSGNYRWTDNEVDRAIDRAVMEYSEYCPLMVKSATILTTSENPDVSISTLTDRLDVLQVEHPVDLAPKSFQSFSVWADVLTFKGGYVGDGAACYVYYTRKHSVAATSTVPTAHNHIIALGAVAYAVSSLAQYVANTSNTGGQSLDKDYNYWAKKAFDMFYAALARARTSSRRIKITGLQAGESTYGEAQYGHTKG